ncbi:MAG: non-canonical purine NTP pyrophosphatase, partial [Candidatus Pacearchaeota archaeon]
MNKLLIATRNQGKLKEISEFLSDLPIKTFLLSDLGINEEFEEKGKTYQENSQNKAIFYSKRSGLPTIADDGGIEINALGGAPGVKSRRWIGENLTDEKIIDHMKKIAKNLPENNRKAFFKTVVSFSLPNANPASSDLSKPSARGYR